jgi:AcrR family transcriptional regulator
MSSPRNERLGRPDWVDAALRALAVGGLGSLSVERLATELGATKGSFYWHFKNRSALVDAALAEWERRDTDQLIERASEIDDPRERLRWLFRVVFSDAGGVGVDSALLADAEDPAVAAALERVATKRLSYIEAQYKRLGVKAASDRAVLTYTAFVGLTQLRRSTPSLAPQGRSSTRYLSNITQWLID